ncbi:hypothetical protein AMATHDRAFT_47425 [Amanita thiersii Skay4041]|uniref:Condensin complex subunit 2 n=1 Tax=Amanita thiersii Skay4041 TaxID=703135 RepID=A0A2A9NRT4_9AGAR|nr:hypothetical protein AMATHDRAFT_47425 [Amanita thiersii Skay4041]
MPTGRRHYAQQDSQPLYADDTDIDTEQDTSKPQKNHKRRISESYLPDNDASFTSDPGRAPLRTKSVNINDDAAEKRKRRKSTKSTTIENSLQGSSTEAAMTSEQGHGDTTRTGKQKQLNTVALPLIADAPLDINYSNFEEWMKMATDNRINAANSWNFALIDYFHDMSLLRNNDDNSINFQRASCTLDGCVKIWTSRVDSVGTETGKLLSNIASGGMNEDDDEVNSDNPDADPGQVRKRQKAHRPGATLAKDAVQLRSKKLDLEFSVDPLFKKTCADFDEGGAQGLLMNHLSLGMGSDSAMRIIFDASDSVGGRVEGEEEDLIDPKDEVDLSYLRSVSTFVFNLNRYSLSLLEEFLPVLSVMENKAISHSLTGFSFSKDAFSFDDTADFFRDNARNGNDDDDDDDFGGGDNAFGGDNNDDPLSIEDFFVGADAVIDGYGGDMIAGDYEGSGGGGSGRDSGDGDGIENGSVGVEGNNRGEARPGVFVPFDPRRMPTERDLVMAMTDADGDGGAMDYFDQNFLKNWAGPEHWKLRKIIRRPDADTNVTKKADKPRQKKEAFKIDFLAPLEEGKDLKQIAKDLFAPVTKGAGINLPGTGKTGTSRKGKKRQTKEKKDDHRLPDDMHFSSRQLVTLFLKPKFYLKMRGQKVKFNEAGDGEVDENFWVQAAAEQAGRNGQKGEDETQISGAVPFNTQFFHDDYDDGPGPGDDDPYDGDGVGVPDAEAGEQDLLAATQGQTRRVRPEFVNYAKRAKRVDVRKLKENIWKNLDIVVPLQRNEGGESMDVDDNEAHPLTDPLESREFGQVITGLQRMYPKEKMEEISTSFCFICLLHLANEQGLKLETGSGAIEQNEEDAMERIVGDIWGLKIYRDPTAIPAA